MTGRARPRLAMYGAASCGGCEVALLNLGERLLTLERVFDVVFLPFLTDTRYDQVRALDDGAIDLCLFNGAIRSSENREMAALLRRKSKTLVAFGSCAHEGCVPALANLTTAHATLAAAFLDNHTTVNPERVTPLPLTLVPEGELALPVLFDTVETLDQVEPVDAVIPGCPPEPDQIWSALERFVAALAGGGEPPPPGAVLGAGRAPLCEECPLERFERPIRRFFRPHELTPEAGVCLLEQGLVCMGIVTRAGCGALCPRVGMGCRGCYGAAEGVEDMGASMVAAIASAVGVGSADDEEEELARSLETAMASLPDPAGTFYRFSLAHSLLRRARTRDVG